MMYTGSGNETIEACNRIKNLDQLLNSVDSLVIPVTNISTGKVLATTLDLVKQTLQTWVNG